MRICILDTQTLFARGGIDALAECLTVQLQARGHDAELVRLPFRPSSPEGILTQMAAVRLLRVQESRPDKVVGLRFPAHLLAFANKTLWLLDPFHETDGIASLGETPEALRVRDLIFQAERRAITEATAVLTVSDAARRHLQRLHGVDAGVLPPPGTGSADLEWDVVVEALLS